MLDVLTSLAEDLTAFFVPVFEILRLVSDFVGLLAGIISEIDRLTHLSGTLN